ncbi:MAG: bifunctional diaminohydroxyphosphoribosylaminopyrimidine deaminase/5-amino-6-(5-phosphoribosylamino)uracil reductase RibD [Pyrinomonadaceae bacterium]
MSAEIETQSSEASQLELDERFMRVALGLSAQGLGLVSPSPLVGCVIVSPAGQIVGEGFYVYDNIDHAEKIALDQAGREAHNATAYVTLEPHAHHGRTPPCTEALIRAGIARVVYAIDDPNPLVAGSGGEALCQAGLEVTTGILAHEAAHLNDAYLHFQRHGRPFVHLKMACSLDGKIGARRDESHWLTGDLARARVHELRHYSDAVLVGANTAVIDDPLLTDRSGRPRRRPLVRVVLDHGLATPAGSRLVSTIREAPVLIFTSSSTIVGESHLKDTGVEIVPVSTVKIDPNEVLANLAGRGIQSVLVEGGPIIAAAFLAAGLVDKITFFIAPQIIGGDGPQVIGPAALADTARLRDVQVTRHGDDTEISGYLEELSH